MKKILIIGFLMGALAVILGAFGAHALKPVMTPGQISTYETGIKYHFIHCIMMIIAAMLYHQTKRQTFLTSAYLMLAGIVLFSFSLYLLSLKQVFGISHWTFLGPITPIGGMFFIFGWISMIIAAIRIKND